MTSTLAVTVTALPTSGTPPLTVLLSSFPTGGLPPYAFAWDFGDGSSQSVSQSAVHSYAAGAFAASCTVTDTLGRSVTSPPIALTVSPVVPPTSFTVLQNQVCVATNPGPLQQIPAPPSLESIPAGPALEAIQGTYYDRCLGTFVGANGVPVTAFVSSVSNLDGSLTIAQRPGTPSRIAEHGQPEHLDRAPDVRHEHLAAGLPSSPAGRLPWGRSSSSTGRTGSRRRCPPAVRHGTASRTPQAPSWTRARPASGGSGSSGAAPTTQRPGRACSRSGRQTGV